MPEPLEDRPRFPRGSNVLDYWLVHAEGMTVEPSGATVEHVVRRAPFAPAEALVVRSQLTRRRRLIPAADVRAVEPATSTLLLAAGRGRTAPALALADRSRGALAATRSAAAVGWRRLRLVLALVRRRELPRMLRRAREMVSLLRRAGRRGLLARHTRRLPGQAARRLRAPTSPSRGSRNRRRAWSR